MVVVARAPVGIPKILPQNLLPSEVAALLRVDESAFAGVMAFGIYRKKCNFMF